MTIYTPIYTSIVAVYAKTGLSSSEVDLNDDNIMRAIIQDAEDELELETRRKFGDAQTVTEYFSIKRSDIVGNAQSSIQLNKYPVQSITALVVYDTQGNAITTYDTLSSAEVSAGTYISDDYRLELVNDPLSDTPVPSGRLVLLSDTFPEGDNHVKCTYTYGYASVPSAVRNVATCLAGIRCWIRFLGGQYNRLNSYGIPQQNVNKGDFYARGMQNIQNLTDEANRLLNIIGRRNRRIVASTGGTR